MSFQNYLTNRSITFQFEFVHPIEHGHSRCILSNYQNHNLAKSGGGGGGK